MQNVEGVVRDRLCRQQTMQTTDYADRGGKEIAGIYQTIDISPLLFLQLFYHDTSIKMRKLI